MSKIYTASSISEHDRVNQPGLKDKVFFYPKEFYVFDNFSSFQVEWRGVLWATSEHAYQAAKFFGTDKEIVERIKMAKSAHDAQKITSENRDKRLKNWDEIKVGVMKEILRNKIKQHSYVLKKLLQSGNREIVEDSWRDNQWGWGEDKKGQNLLGKIWMELRQEFAG